VPPYAAIPIVGSLVPFYIAVSLIGTCGGGQSWALFGIAFGLVAMGLALVPLLRTAGLMGLFAAGLFVTGALVTHGLGCPLL
jgi:hypothetical protein